MIMASSQKRFAVLVLTFFPAAAFNPSVAAQHLSVDRPWTSLGSQIGCAQARMTAVSDMGVGGDAISQKDTIERAKHFGVFLDMPLCRFSWCILPQQQVMLNIWQPMYVEMFSELLSKPGPHYYLHVLLPGGAESLGQSGYELEPGSNSSLMGTLMRIVYAQRLSNDRLSLVVQGLARGVVLRATQYLPYSRGDVQILADKEVLLGAARASERYLRNADRVPADSVDDLVRYSLVTSASAAETQGFFPYEAIWLSIDADQKTAKWNQFNESAADTILEIDDAVRATLQNTPILAAEKDVFDLGSLYNQSRVPQPLQAVVTAAKVEAVAGGDAAAAAAEVKELAELAILEVQLWLEFDTFIQYLSSLINGAEPESPGMSQLLSLLPPPPQPAGWPSTFKLQKMALTLESQYRLTEKSRAKQDADAPRAISFVPLDARYPPRKRAERLSWLIWGVIGGQKIGVNAYGGSPFQEVIEAAGTKDRLQLALDKLKKRLSDIRQLLKNKNQEEPEMEKSEQSFASADDVMRLNKMFYSNDEDT